MTLEQDLYCARADEAAPYVLGRLHPRRLDNYARHLRHCSQCAEEVELLRSAADAVPLLSQRHVQPPDQLEPQPGRPVPTLAAATSAKPAGPPPRPVPTQRRRLLKNPVPKPAVWGFVALAILAVVTIALSHRAASTRYVHIPAGWTNGGAALQLEGDKLQVLVTGMPRASVGHGYQVWVLSKASKQLVPTTAWLRLNRKGQAGATVPGDYHDWDAVAVYVEATHGSETTKSGAVVVADLRKQR